MIIRRISEGIRSQDWFTVVVEIFIVVIGIYVGLQVDDWQNERKNKKLEQVYLERLHGEIVGVSPILNNHRNLVQSTFNNLTVVIAKLHSANGENKLETQECTAILFLHRYVAPNIMLPVITELMATGNFNQIQNIVIKQDIVKHMNTMDRLEVLINDVVNQRSVLSTIFPDLIQFSTHPDDYDEKHHTCDWEKMKENQSFQNQFLDNSSRYAAYNMAISDATKALETLHDKLDLTLVLTHNKSEEGGPS